MRGYLFVTLWLAMVIAARVIMASLTMPATPAPAACTFDGGGTIASGDAAKTTDGREWVCTDGTLVRVTHYGN